MTWVLFSLLANVSICWVEYVNHAFDKPTWIQALPYTGLPIIVAQYALYRSFSGASSLFLAWCVFTVGNSIMRVISVKFFVGQTVEYQHILGIAIMLLGAVMLKVGGK